MESKTKEELYTKKVNCPVCGVDFNTKKVRSSAIRVKERDEDFCPHYNSQNPLFYSVFICPNCGYSALEKFFGIISEVNKERIKGLITPKWHQRSYGDERSLEDAIEVYKLALLNHQIIESKGNIIGEICLRLSWFYRYLKDTKENEFIQFTIKTFEKAYTKEKMAEEEYDEINMLYLLGELNRRVHNYREAIDWFDKTLSHDDINKKRHIKIKARNQWSLAREEYAKHKKESAG